MSLSTRTTKQTFRMLLVLLLAVSAVQAFAPHPARTRQVHHHQPTSTTVQFAMPDDNSPDVLRRINILMIDFTDMFTIVFAMFVCMGIGLNMNGYAYTFNTNEQILRIDTVENFRQDEQWKIESERYEREYMLKQQPGMEE
uniref:Uncharacterized protein n=1 Tax=Craspedostauros australis TaxID=1486917 RepID=A0A7R9ZQE4_9STRA|mmetsp:Transcript_5726/g.15526  ORF Transcript_5726/g.15526 Transcript_5726/m.15526 type:complete len:141 (+) Transcript_5726:209-631(+)|eukprot:CAMPEP_0198112648 /NCGR_PEP_ID=MMETSP1442-20131203/4470_1 /TAXON_ID= /ORGANISM="Craspedostauros australis, Strain CCMP3328" /LENGTH=140 /DNA_ID=CAMNT_0043769503 /DNA_START=154 /DNA_END=576 /DNA_ORIENTATION=-